MEIDVFISYHTNSSRTVVEAVVNRLEGVGIRCWYAPRDVVGSYAGSIVQAIKACSVFILMLNQPAAESPQVLNELNIVTSRLGRKESVTIVPFHIADEDLEMPPDAEYYISRMHWIDAIRPPMDERIGELTCWAASPPPPRRPGSRPLRRRPGRSTACAPTRPRPGPSSTAGTTFWRRSPPVFGRASGCCSWRA